MRNIEYCPKENKVFIKQFSGHLLEEKTHEFTPKELIKHRGKTVFPLIGYKTFETGWEKTFATESITKWNDRKLFDSMVTPPVPKKVRPPVKKFDKKGGKNKDIDVWEN